MRSFGRGFDEIQIGSFKVEGSHQVQSVILGSGEEIVCSNIIYADRWDVLPRYQGLPKNLPFIRGRAPASVLQAIFGHEEPVGANLLEGFYASLHKEAGEELSNVTFGDIFHRLEPRATGRLS